MKLTTKEKEAVLKIIEQKGECSNVSCYDCPLFSDKTGMSHAATLGINESTSGVAYTRAKLRWLKAVVSGAMWEQEDLD